MKHASGQPDPVTDKLINGIERLALALQVERRRAAEAYGLNPAQSAILRLLSARTPPPMRMGEIAEYLGVRQPTATDSVAALERKGLVRRQTSPHDSRVTIVELAGQLDDGLSEATFAAAAVADLSPEERGQLVVLITKWMRSLQRRGAIPQQRMCATCKYFQPNAHPNENLPHHCGLLDVPFGNIDLRLDCPEHQPAEVAEQSTNAEPVRSRSASDPLSTFVHPNRGGEAQQSIQQKKQ